MVASACAVPKASAAARTHAQYAEMDADAGEADQAEQEEARGDRAAR